MKPAWHPGSEKLEQYVLGQLGFSDHPEMVRVEEHLLVCPGCVNTAEHTLEFAQAMREARAQWKATA